MHDDDALDDQLFESGDIAGLLARYESPIRAICLARLRGHVDAEDVAQNVRLRLLSEFQRGRSYSVPYRVVVFKVTEWTVKEYFEHRRFDDPLPDDWDADFRDPESEVVSRFYVEDLLADLPRREREVAELRWIQGLQADQIADELSIDRNNVYQALWRATDKLRKGDDVG
jgi:RNA polymerase sigma factor (sigma-70 family)